MVRKDADIHLIFLSGNGVIFTQPSDDLWYHLDSTSSFFSLSTDGQGKHLYAPREPASPLGCASQYQFCSTAFPGTSGCGPLVSLRDAITGAAPFFETPEGEMTTNSLNSESSARFGYFKNMFFSTSPTDLFAILSQLGPTALASQENLFSGLQGPIAENQWQLDVSHWWDISMAVLQSKLLDTATFFENIHNIERLTYETPEFQKLCSNQVSPTFSYVFKPPHPNFFRGPLLCSVFHM